jgi:3-deoxy-7-phosphoheptulonate synthase
MARGAAVVGADGLLVEVHPTPEKALSDGVQSLSLDEFDEMMQDLRRYVPMAPSLIDLRPQLLASGGAC